MDGMRHPKRRKNGFLMIARSGSSYERAFEDHATRAGYTFLHTGWPDYLIWKRRPDGSLEVRLVEVKSSDKSNGKLTPEQKLLHDVLLEGLGIEIEISHGEVECK